MLNSSRLVTPIIGLVLAAGACSSSGSDSEATPSSSSPASASRSTDAPATADDAPPPATTMPAPTTVEPKAGTLTATLQVDGKPVAGVEVWLGVTQPGMGSEARYVCSDDAGVVKFEEVPFDASLTSITGPGTAGSCRNPLFLDTSSSPAYPLSPTTLLTANSSISDNRDLGVVAVPRLPGSMAIARESTAFYVSCFRDGDIDEAGRHLESYDRAVAAEDGAGALSYQEMQLIVANTNVLRFLDDLPEPCTEVTTVEQVPLLFDWTYTDEADRPQLTVIDPGVEPRRALALTPHKGTMSDTTHRQVISVTQSIDGEMTTSTTTEVDLAVRTEVVAADEEGFIITSTIRDFRVNSDDEVTQGGTQAALRELVGTLEARLVAPTGEVLATDLAGFDFLGSATTALSYVLPTEPLGVGASWTVDSRFDVLGADANASTTYTIVDLDEARLTVDIETVHDIDVEAFAETLGLEGADMSLTQSGSGRAIWDLATAGTIEDDFEQQQLLSLTATLDGQTGNLEQITAFSIKTPSPAKPERHPIVGDWLAVDADGSVITMSVAPDGAFLAVDTSSQGCVRDGYPGAWRWEGLGAFITDDRGDVLRASGATYCLTTDDAGVERSTIEFDFIHRPADDTLEFEPDGVLYTRSGV